MTTSATEARLDGLKAKLERHVLAISDLQDAAAGARYLEQTRPIEPNPSVRRALITGMFTSYARAFNDARGFSAPKTSGLTQAQREVHGWALEERNTVWAHEHRGSSRGVSDDG
jgi:hypothetical protein